MDYTFHWRPVLKKLLELLEASLIVEVAVISVLLGIFLGLGIAISRMSGATPLRMIATGWIEIARNTPVLFQFFFFDFGLGAFQIHLSPYIIVLFGLTFNNAGYLAENFRGGFQSIPNTQIWAARSLGMTQWQTYTRIIIPQVMRIVYHPLTNQMVWAVLMSSLGMLVSFRDLSDEIQFFDSKTFRVGYFAVTAMIYYAIVKIILFGSKLLARRLFRY